ncbi:MAG: tetratricopeptide repeat protein [Anaerolineae bacterium]|nr:tetratricopeptide repeat protein [Anaerolineae bacterium]
MARWKWDVGLLIFLLVVLALIIRLQPRSNDEVTTLTSRARQSAGTSRYDEAVADLTTAIEIEPENPELYVLRGQMYLYLYEWDSVLNDYNTAIGLNPQYADAYFYRGILYYSILQTGQELRPEALADFQHYLELAPEGSHAVEAERYIATIQAELDALNDD